MYWIKKLIFPLTLTGAFCSAMIACGRKSSDDVRVASRGNIAIDGAGIVSASTLEGQPYTIRVVRVYRNGNGGVQNNGTTNCQLSFNQYSGFYPQSNFNSIYLDVLVNGLCKTMILSNAGALASDPDLGLEVSYTCDSANSCDTIYVDLVGRNPRSYTSNTGATYTAQVGGGFTAGFAGNWAMQPNTEIKQVGILALVSQLRIAATLELQSLYSQRLRIDQLMTELQRINSETINH